MLYNEAPLLRNKRQRWPAENNNVKPHSYRQVYCYMKYIRVTACFIFKFSCCVSCSLPYRLQELECGLTSYRCSVESKHWHNLWWPVAGHITA